MPPMGTSGRRLVGQVLRSSSSTRRRQRRGQLAQANNLEGSLAQGGPDNFLFTTTSIAPLGLYYTNTSGTITGDFITTSAGCVPAQGAVGLSPTGAALALMPGGYIVQVTPNAANICIGIPSKQSTELQRFKARIVGVCRRQVWRLRFPRFARHNADPEDPDCERSAPTSRYAAMVPTAWRFFR